MIAERPWEADYEALYREHAERLLRLCRLLLHDPTEAEEVVQEVFLKAMRIYESSTTERIAWRGWLTRVAVNACRDRHRAGWWSRWRRHDPIVGLEIADESPSPERLAVGRETRERIWGVFRQLPTRQREVLVLRHIEGWSTSEIAEGLGVSSGSVKRHLFRAVGRLRAGLGGER